MITAARKRSLVRVFRAWVGVPALLAVSAVVAVLLGPYDASLFATVALASISAMSLTMLMGWAGQPSLVTSAFLLLGGYIAAGGEHIHLGFPFTFVVAVTVGSALGALVSLPASRASGIQVALVTLAIAVIAADLGNVLETRTGSLAGYTVESPKLFGGTLDQPQEWALLAAIVTIAAYLYLAYLKTTRIGRAWIMIREDRDAASVAGVDVPKYVALAFGISSGLTSGAGVLLAYYLSTVSYASAGLNQSLQFIVIIILGGIGSLGGAILGSALVVLLPVALTQLTDGIDVGSASLIANNIPYIANTLYAVIGLAVLVFAPGGLAGLGGRLPRVSVLLRLTHLLRRSAKPQAKSREIASGAASFGCDTEKVISGIDLSRVTIEYEGGQRALSAVSAGFEMGQITAVLGANGAGKSSLLYAIAGFPPGSGGRLIDGQVRVRQDSPGSLMLINGLSPAARAAEGIVLIPAEDKVFVNLTVRDHLREAIDAGRSRPAENVGPVTLSELFITFPALQKRQRSRASLLSGGERQQLALACAVARKARILLVDEASLGLAPATAEAMGLVLKRLRVETGLTIVMVEQMPEMAAEVAGRLVYLNAGEVELAGPPSRETLAAIETAFVGSARS